MSANLSGGRTPAAWRVAIVGGISIAWIGIAVTTLGGGTLVLGILTRSTDTCVLGIGALVAGFVIGISGGLFARVAKALAYLFHG